MYSFIFSFVCGREDRINLGNRRPSSMKGPFQSTDIKRLQGPGNKLICVMELSNKIDKGGSERSTMTTSNMYGS